VSPDGAPGFLFAYNQSYRRKFIVGPATLVIHRLAHVVGLYPFLNQASYHLNLEKIPDRQVRIFVVVTHLKPTIDEIEDAAKTVCDIFSVCSGKSNA
jgi:hypothetical protein